MNSFIDKKKRMKRISVFRMLILGLTGGIASGKSSSSNYLKQRSIEIIDADKLARLVVEPGRSAYRKIIEKFGHFDIVEQNGREIDRKRLANLIFADEKLRKQLNRITHVYIRREAIKQLIECFFRLKPMVVWDVPLLFEVGLDRFLFHTLVIYCDRQIQFERLKNRDQLDHDEQIRQRIDAQLDLNVKARRARYVIENNGSKALLEQRLDELLEKIRPSRFETLFWFCFLSIPLGLIYFSLRIWDLFDR